MAEELKALIEKIQQEGIRAAEEKAKSIIEEAEKKAEAILLKAKEESSFLLNQAKADIRQMTESGEKSLQQASRNTLLSLKEEIEATLQKVIAACVGEVLSPEEMAKIIHELIKQSIGKQASQIAIALNKSDLEKLENSLFAKLREELKKSLTLKAQDDIRAGFTISFDAGRSCFDFTDQALSEYLGVFLKPKLAKLFQGAVLKSG